MLSSATTCAMLQQYRGPVCPFLFSSSRRFTYREGEGGPRKRERKTPIHLHISLTSPFQPSRRGIAGYHPGIGFDVGSDSRFTVHHFTRASVSAIHVRSFVRFATSLASSRSPVVNDLGFPFQLSCRSRRCKEKENRKESWSPMERSALEMDRN